MKRIALYLGLATALVAACSIQEEDFKAPQQDDVIYYASFENPAEEGTRVYANEDLLLRWTADDRVSIFGKNTYNQQYQFLGETGDNSGGFSKVDVAEYVTGNPISHTVSVYPYQASTKITEDEVLTVTLPSEQHYAVNTFGLGANTMVSVSADNFLQYKNVGGFLRVSLYGEGVSVSSIVLKGNNGEKLAGKATVTTPLDGVPSTVMANDATTEITLVCDSPVALGATAEESTDFWFVVPPVTFSKGFTISICQEGGVSEKATTKSITIERNNLSKMSPIVVEPKSDDGFISFEDANFKAYCVNHYDRNGDGEVSIDEVESVYSINNLNTDNITSMNEIKYFRSLQFLIIVGSYQINPEGGYEVSGALESLDLRFNTELGLFSCTGNPLRRLDLSSNSRLYSVSCTYGCLTEFIPGPALKSVSLPYNQLTSLDFSGCASLESIYVHDNLLTSLDISQCNRLKTIKCRNNQIQNLDTGNTVSLTTLDCSNNQLQSLDISKSTALTTLDCSNNQLQSLDISKSMALTTVRCYNNQIESLVLGNNESLESLLCSNNQISGHLVINTLPSLKSLACSNNSISALSIDGCGLTSLNCSRNQIRSLEIEGLSSSLKTLDCGYNSIQNLNLGQFVSLKELQCSGCEDLLSAFLPQTAPDLSFSFHRCTSLSTIDFPEDLTSIPIEAFMNCSSLTEISIPQSVTSIGYYTFAHCTALTSIDIPDSVTSLGIGAFNHTGLTAIRIPNSITSIEEGTFALCDKLEEVILPEGLVSLGNQAFLKCYGLKTITIPSSVTNIGSNAFLLCSALSSVTVKAVVPPVASSGLFVMSGIQNIYVPAESVEAYKTAPVWSDYANLIQAIPPSLVPVPEAIDMGLSVKWASLNLGASRPEEYGNYYAWGEIEVKSNYSWETYKWCMGSEYTRTKYCTDMQCGDNGFTDGKVILDPEDDVAHVALKGKWRMPTHDEWTELRSGCTWTWTTENGVYGRKFTSKTTGNSIFLPAAGFRSGIDLDSADSRGRYWSSSLHESDQRFAWCFSFYSGNVLSTASDYPYYGFSVRPVCE